MVQSHIMNVLPRRLLANLWATQETRVSLSNLMVASSEMNKNIRKHNHHHPVAASSSFLCSELPIRYTHILRLLSTLHEDALQTPLIRGAAQRYLVDICTLLHPSLRQTSPRSFSQKVHKLRQRQAQSLIWLRYALTSSSMATSHSVMLMDHINAISFSIHLLLDQHVTWSNDTGNQVQVVCPLEIAQQAIVDARKTCGDTFGNGDNVPLVTIKKSISLPQEQDPEFTHIPNILHRILYECCLLALRSHYTQASDMIISTSTTTSGWLKRHCQRVFQSTQQQITSLQLDVYGGPTSIGYRLNSSAPLSQHELYHDIPRNLLGLPSCPSILRRSTHQQSTSSSTSSSVSAPTMSLQQYQNYNNNNDDDDDDDDDLEHAEWSAWSGWRSAKTMARHFGGHLDAVSSDGLGSTMYLALDRDCQLLERYPSSLFHHRFSSAPHHRHRHSLQRASSELDAFLYAIGNPNNTTTNINYTPATHHHHAVSLTAAVGHA